MGHLRLALSAGAWLAVAACASAAPSPADPVAEPALAPPVWDDVELRTALAGPCPVRDGNALVVLPPQGPDDLADRALGVQALLETTLGAHPAVALARLSDVAPELFATAAALTDWRRAGPALPPRLACAAPAAVGPAPLERSAARWVVLARLLPGDTTTVLGTSHPALHLRLVDRLERRWWDATAALDAPHYWALRFAVLDLLSHAGVAPSELRGVVDFSEDLPLAALDALGALRARALAARLASPDPAPPAVLPDGAEHSYVAHVIVARQIPDCKAATPLLLEAVDLNPLGRDAHLALGDCGSIASDALARALGDERAGCGFAGKGLMGTLGARSGVGVGVVTGVGGFYVGTACGVDSAEIARAALAFAQTPLQRANALRLLGLAQHQAGDLDAAIVTLRAATDAAAEAGWAPLYAETLLRLGDALHQASRHDDALASLAAAGAAAAADPDLLGRVENSVGLVHQARGAYAPALAAFAAARARFEALGDDVNLAVTLANLGNTHVLLGQYADGLPLLERALALKRAVRSAGGETAVLADLGAAWLAAGDPAKAAELLAQAAARGDDPGTRAAIENNLGQAYRATDHLDDARAAFADALRYARDAHTRPIEGVALHNLASLAAARGALDEADARYREALGVRRLAGDVAGEGLTLNDLMDVAARRGLPRLAILYGKLAVAAHQRVRESARAIGAAAHGAFIATRAATYRRLAELLIGAGRLVEAEAALRLLKGDELARWARRDHDTGDVPLTPTERTIADRVASLGDDTLAIAREYEALARQRPLTTAAAARLDVLGQRLTQANARFNAYLAGLRDVLAADRPVAALRQELAIGPVLKKLGPDVVAIYTLLTGDRYRAIVVSAEGRVAVEQPIALATLNQLVADLRAALQDPRVDPRPAARKLYDVVFAPLEAHIKAAGAHTLMWSLDGALRYVPVNALYDGERWLIERYGNTLFSPILREWLTEPPAPDWRVLAFGTTRAFPGFPALPGVAREVEAIVGDPAQPGDHGAFSGEPHLDAAFTRATLMAGLRQRFPVVHIATHFHFEPGDDRASFLLLGDGTRLPIADIAALPNVFGDVDLLALSACSTAVGDAGARDGREVESFAVLAQEKGAHAIFATLWPVSDASTSLVMRLFYQVRAAAPGLSKLDALRRAQRWLLQGHIDAPAGVIDPDAPNGVIDTDAPNGVIDPDAPNGVIDTDAPNGVIDPASPVAGPGSDRGRGPVALGAPTPGGPAVATGFRHPYYWAPFVLVGNWL